jgi:hypothetical protein
MPSNSPAPFRTPERQNLKSPFHLHSLTKLDQFAESARIVGSRRPQSDRPGIDCRKIDRPKVDYLKDDLLKNDLLKNDHPKNGPSPRSLPWPVPVQLAAAAVVGVGGDEGAADASKRSLKPLPQPP